MNRTGRPLYAASTRRFGYDSPNLTQIPNRVRAMELRTLGLASLGSALEFYDFIIFVFLAPVIARLFFPTSMPDWLRQSQTFGLFAAGYVVRPLGGLVLAHFGDMRGRKRVFTASVLLMAVPTLLIGVLPTYASIGLGAPLLLLLMRLVQGMAIGGEAPGAWVFVAEHARPGETGFAVGLLSSGLTSGILLGSLVAIGVNTAFNPTQVLAGYWRLPFLLGGVLGFIAMLLRRWLSETPVFEEMQRRAAVSRAAPLRTVLRSHKPAVVVSILSTWMLTAAILMVVLMTPTLLQTLFGVSPQQALMANFAGTIAQCVAIVAVGAAADRFGVRRVAVPILLLLIVATYGLYFGAEQAPYALVPLYILAGIGAGGAVLTPLVMVRAFPAAIRFTGVSFSYNIGYAVFGGITPLLVSATAHWSRFVPAHYVAAVTLLGLISILWAPDARADSHSLN
jgi:MFS family permease